MRFQQFYQFPMGMCLHLYLRCQINQQDLKGSSDKLHDDAGKKASQQQVPYRAYEPPKVVPISNVGEHCVQIALLLKDC